MIILFVCLNNIARNRCNTVLHDDIVIMMVLNFMSHLGFAKCGTTALCDILVSHPDVRFYRKKETDIFTKMHFSIAEFERKVNTDKDTINSTLSRQGHVWLDCSAGAFRDFNAAAHLQRYSPDTKVIMMVRDPWQVTQCSVQCSQQIAASLELIT